MLVARTDETESRDRIVAGLFDQIAEVDATGVDARRGAGLEAIDHDWTVAKA